LSKTKLGHHKIVKDQLESSPDRNFVYVWFNFWRRQKLILKV